MAILNDAIAGLKGDTIRIETAFKLYITYGFPLDQPPDVARGRDLKVDEGQHNVAMDKQRKWPARQAILLATTAKAWKSTAALNFSVTPSWKIPAA